MFKKAALALAVLGVASSTFGADVNSFVDDASLDIGLRTYYFWGEEDFRNNPSKGTEKSHAMAQGIRAEYKSGYLYDLVGFDVGLYGAVGLIKDDGKKSSWGLLDGGTRNEDIFKYAATAKVKLNEAAQFKYGVRKLNSELYSDSDSRLTPELTEFASIEVDLGDFDAYVHQIKRSSRRTQEKLEDFDGKVYLTGAHYVFNNDLTLSAAYGQQRNNSRQYFGQVDYPFAVSDGILTVSGNYQHIVAIGSAKGQQGDDTAGLWSAKVAYETGPLLLELAYGKADDYQLGSLNWTGGNQNGGSNLLTDNAYYVTLDAPGMNSYYAGISYDLSESIAGLILDTGYMLGKNDHLKSWEYYARVNYDVPGVENLWLGATWASGRDDYSGKDNANDVDWSHARLQLRYNFSAL